MMRHLTTLVLSGISGSIVLAGNAEACHRKRCVCRTSVACLAPAPMVYVQPAYSVCPTPCVRPAACCCAPRYRRCGGGGLFGGLCHKRSAIAVACAAPVYYGYAGAPSGQYVASPQAPAHP
jgi:hypothetical protein